MSNTLLFLLLGLLIGLIPFVVLLLRHSGNAGTLGGDPAPSRRRVGWHGEPLRLQEAGQHVQDD
jgi:hypothetical protein